MNAFAKAVELELQRARAKHAWPRPPSFHHAHSVLQEDVDEFWTEVKAQSPDGRRVLEELIQVGAMAQRAAEELGLIERGPTP